MFSNHLYAFHATLTPDTQTKLPAESLLKQWTPTAHPPDGLRRVRHRHAGGDAAALADLYRDGLSPWEGCAELAMRDPDRTSSGARSPLEGRKALDLMEVQVKEYGAKAFKFYNVRYDYGSPYPWRMDDPRLPSRSSRRRRNWDQPDRRAQGRPLGRSRSSTRRPWDLDGAAAAFPDTTS